jgi:hypothetical protein
MHKLALYNGHSAKIDVEMLKDQLFHPDTNIRAFFAERKGEAYWFILFMNALRFITVNAVLAFQEPILMMNIAIEAMA